MTARTKNTNKIMSLIINKQNLVTQKDELNRIIKEDPNIDLEKIKKYFENVINEKHFLISYGKQKTRNADGIIEESGAKQQK